MLPSPYGHPVCLSLTSPPSLPSYRQPFYAEKYLAHQINNSGKFSARLIIHHGDNLFYPKLHTWGAESKSAAGTNAMPCFLSERFYILRSINQSISLIATLRPESRIANETRCREAAISAIYSKRLSILPWKQTSRWRPGWEFFGELSSRISSSCPAWCRPWRTGPTCRTCPFRAVRLLVSRRSTAAEQHAQTRLIILI